jgi:hypothetical protein
MCPRKATGFFRAAAAVADDERGGFAVGDDVDVGLRESRGLEPRREVLRERGHLAEPDRRLERHGPAEDLPRVGLVGREGGRRGRGSGRERGGEQQDERVATSVHEGLLAPS